jgi:hypothetical protein
MYEELQTKEMIEEGLLELRQEERTEKEQKYG